MEDKRILYVSSEVVPYLAENEVSLMSYDVTYNILLSSIIYSTLFIGNKKQAKVQKFMQLFMKMVSLQLIY